MGYPELDPTTVTTAQELVQASSDEERARYSFAELRLDQVLKKDPQNSEALLDLGQSELALGSPHKSEQTLAEAAQLGSPQTRATANQRIAALRQMDVQRVPLTKPEPAEAARPGADRADHVGAERGRDSRPRDAGQRSAARRFRTASTRCSTRCPISAASTFAAARASRRS